MDVIGMTAKLYPVGVCPLCKKYVEVPAFLPDYHNGRGATYRLPAICRRHLPAAILGGQVQRIGRYAMAAEVAHRLGVLADGVLADGELADGDKGHTVAAGHGSGNRAPGFEGWRQRYAKLKTRRRGWVAKRRRTRRTGFHAALWYLSACGFAVTLVGWALVDHVFGGRER